MGIGWLLGHGGGVRVPGRVSWVRAGLIQASGLIGIGAVVGGWIWSGSLEPSVAIEAEDLQGTLLHVQVSEVLQDLLVVVLVGLLLGDLGTELVVLVGVAWQVFLESHGGN